MLLDFDPRVVGVSSQPFWLTWTDKEGRARAHVPDFFVRRDDGSALVLDCRPAQNRKPTDLAVFELTRHACESLGWEYRLVGAPDAITTANVRWLAGYRHPRHHVAGLSDALRAAFATPTPLMAGADGVGDPIAVLPVLFHLLWLHELAVDLSLPLHEAAVVGTGVE
jgi:TnsA-like endonuclease N terminal